MKKDSRDWLLATLSGVLVGSLLFLWTSPALLMVALLSALAILVFVFDYGTIP